MRRLFALHFFVVLFVVCFGAPSLRADEGEKPTKSVIITGPDGRSQTVKTRSIKSWSRTLPAESANFPSQRVLSIATLLEKLKLPAGEKLEFQDSSGNSVKVRSQEAMAQDSALALMSTFHGAWKLVRMGHTADEHSYLLRSVSKIIIEPSDHKGDPVALRTNLCKDARVYHSLAEALKNKNSACVLNLSGQKLSKLPATLFSLTELRELYLGRNELQSLPPEIGQLTQLQHLVVGRNQLKTLPPQIRELKNLEVLKLGRNQIETLPPEIGQLTRVRKLELDHNRLRRLPDAVASMTSLRELELAANPIEELPVALRSLKQLKSIELDKEAFSPERQKKISAQFEPIEIEWE